MKYINGLIYILKPKLPNCTDFFKKCVKKYISE